MFWPCVHFPALRAQKHISKFSFSNGSSFPKLLNLWVETQSRDPALRGTEEHWDYGEAVPYHERSPHKQVRPFKKALTILLSSTAAFAAVEHEPCAVLSSTSRRQRTTDQCIDLSNGMWGDVQEVSSLGSIWVLEMASKAHCILSVAFGFTVLVL